MSPCYINIDSNLLLSAEMHLPIETKIMFSKQSPSIIVLHAGLIALSLLWLDIETR